MKRRVIIEFSYQEAYILRMIYHSNKSNPITEVEPPLKADLKTLVDNGLVYSPLHATEKRWCLTKKGEGIAYQLANVQNTIIEEES